jgi:hypothetical protein
MALVAALMSLGRWEVKEANMRNLVAGMILTGLLAAGQSPPEAPTPLYRVTVVGRTAKAIRYEHRSGSTKIGFQGTVLLPDARGEAMVKSDQGAILLDARFERLEPPTRYGREYLTYVLWAITPEGRAVNLGEVVANHANKARIKTATELQAFGLIVTAEPYFAVTQPSDVVVLENVVLPETAGRVQEIQVRYELLRRGHYTFDASRAAAAPAGRDKVSLEEYEALLELYQARNAVQMARAAGADRHAGDTYSRAEHLLQQAEQQHASRTNYKTVVATARQAAQTAEDARLITVRRLEENSEDGSRQASSQDRRQAP